MDKSSGNALNIDEGLIETLNIRLNDVSINPDSLWFESICKYVYEKIKNEDIFLTNFYRSSQYRKLLLELEFYSNCNIDGEIDSTTATQLLNQCETGSDSNSGDLIFDDDTDFISIDSSDLVALNTPQKVSPKHLQPAKEATENPTESSGETAKTLDMNLLDVIGSGVSKHYRSHSDCTGLVQNIDDFRIEPLTKELGQPLAKPALDSKEKVTSPAKANNNDSSMPVNVKGDSQVDRVTLICPQHRLSAKIINTAINCEGQFAVYAIQVTVIEDNQQKSWHVYRRYSRFLDLKKLLVKRVCIKYSTRKEYFDY